MLGDPATGRLALAQGCFVRNLDAEEALDRPLFVRSRVQQVDPYRVLRAIGDVGGVDAPTVDLQHRPVRVRLQMSGLGGPAASAFHAAGGRGAMESMPVRNGRIVPGSFGWPLQSPAA